MKVAEVLIYRTNCRTVAGELYVVVLTLLMVLTGVSGRTISREISDEIPKPVEISMPDEMLRRCQPVPHDALWLRLNIAPRLADHEDIPIASGPHVNEYPQAAPLSQVVVQPPEVSDEFRLQDDVGGRYRRSTEQGRRRRKRRRKQQEQQQRHHRLRHARRQLRRRTKLVAELKDGEAWQCHMQTNWQRMPDDVFPPYVQTGSCVQTHCMMGLYECHSRKYATRILRRVPGRCNPVPVTGNSATAGFEEAWIAEEYHVVVGCECSKRRASGWYEGV